MIFSVVMGDKSTKPYPKENANGDPPKGGEDEEEEKEAGKERQN
jgi:hypothetical protein